MIYHLLLQEAYWRIPGHLSVATLNGYCNLLQEALDNTLTLADGAEAISQQNDESDDGEDIFDKLREMTKPPENEELNIGEAFNKLKKSRSKAEKKIKNLPENSEENDNDSIFDRLRENHSQKATTSKRSEFEVEDGEKEPISEAVDSSFQKKKSRRIMDSDDESIDMDMNEQMEETELEVDISITKKHRNVIESDSEDENNSQHGNLGTTQEYDGKRTRSSSDSDSGKPTGKRSRVIESDDE